MKITILRSLVLISLLFSCKSSTEPDKTVTITLQPKSKSTVAGSALFTEKKGTVLLKVTLSGLQPGVHAIHIHEKADCSSADATSAGGHWNPTFSKHGKWGEGDYHKGDIGNFTADPNGNATVEFSTDQWCIGCGDPNKDILNKGLIVHEKADDFVSQPTGNAGGRVACAGIIK